MHGPRALGRQRQIDHPRRAQGQTDAGHEGKAIGQVGPERHQVQDRKQRDHEPREAEPHRRVPDAAGQECDGGDERERADETDDRRRRHDIGGGMPERKHGQAGVVNQQPRGFAQPGRQRARGDRFLPDLSEDSGAQDQIAVEQSDQHG